MTDREEKIRQRAYGIWEQEGYPHGRADDHWQRAVHEVEKAAPAQPDLLETGAAASPAAKPAPKRRKAATGAPATRKRTTTKR